LHSEASAHDTPQKTDKLTLIDQSIVAGHLTKILVYLSFQQNIQTE
jgi:hypothetical protein